MNKSFCSLHDKEEEKYICVHPVCLKKVDNKLCCIKCFSSNHRKIKLEQHQFLNISELEQKAIHNYQNLKTHLNDEIQKNQQLHTAIEERLTEILLSLSTWSNNQKKMFNDITENSSQILAENIIVANSLMQSPSLDKFIYFYKLNLLKKQKEHQDIRDHSMRQLEYQLSQIEQKRDIMTNQITFIQREHFLNFALIDYQMEFNYLNDYQFEKCEKHLSKKKMLCTHPNCLQDNPQQLECIHCITEDHQEHQQGKYVKNIAIIQKEQQEKKELIGQLKKKYSFEIKKSIDKNLLKINVSQQNYYQNNEKQKEKAIFLEQQQLDEFLNPETPQYIFENIDSNLLKTTKDQINLFYQQLYYNFEVKFSTIFVNQVDDLKFCTELDFNSKQFFQYIINLEQELELRQLKLEQYKRQIEFYSKGQVNFELQMNQQVVALNQLSSNVEKIITSVQQFNQANLESQNHSVKNLQSSFEKAIVPLQEMQTNQELQNYSIHKLQSSLENAITNLSQLTQKNSESQNLSIFNLRSNIQSVSTTLQLLTLNEQQTSNISINDLRSSLDEAIKPLQVLTTNSVKAFNDRLTGFFILSIIYLVFIIICCSKR